MKKFLKLILVAAAVFIAPAIALAQPGTTNPVPKLATTTAFGNTIDTVDNTETHVTTPADGLTRNWSTGFTCKVIVKKISGTVGGTLALQGSMDGTEWVTIGNAATPTDASNNYSFNTVIRWAYFRVNYTGAGTMSASMKTYFLWY
jgi:hypothetical protein